MKRTVTVEVPEELFKGAERVENLIQGYYGDVVEVRDEDGTLSVIIRLPYVALNDLELSVGVPD